MEGKKKRSGESDSGLTDTIIDKLSSSTLEAGIRDTTVMTRLNTNLVHILDMLVKLGLFKSRSEVVASIVEKVLLSDPDLLKKLDGQMKKLEEIQGTVKTITHQLLSDSD
jgi:Arc/MetJ-type ribon-helix-helix transcriptional regulator